MNNKTGKIGQFGAESRITYGGVKWVVLDVQPDMSLCFAEDVLKYENGAVRHMAFDTDNRNNFAVSSIRSFLNNDFLEEMAAAGADKEAFVSITLNLTSDDGLDDYGTDSAKIGLITDQMYRRFRKIIPKVSEDYWTCTPFSTERNGYKSIVRRVYTSGALDYDCGYSGGWGVRPLCALKTGTLVSYDENEVSMIWSLEAPIVIEENGQEKEAKRLFSWYSKLKNVGFTEEQAFRLIKLAGKREYR